MNEDVLKESSAEQEVLDSEHKLPTSPEIARQSIASLISLLPQLPTELRKLFTDYKEVKACIVGLSPEVNLNNDVTKNDGSEGEISPTQSEMLLNYINQQDTGFIIVKLHPMQGNETGEKYSLINLRAAQRVVSNYPMDFPQQARIDIKKWLIENTSEWRDEADMKQI